MRVKQIIAILMILAALVLTACGSPTSIQQSPSSTTYFPVITHIYPIQSYTQTTTIPTTTSATTSATKPATTTAIAPAVTTTTRLIPPSPEDLIKQGFIFPEIPRILSEQLKQMMDKSDDFILVDARLSSSFTSGHIPGAINIPYNDPSPNFTQQWVNDQLTALPGDKMIIFYCD